MRNVSKDEPMNENNQTKPGSQRDFDWGPPSNRFAETFKEWLVYFFILAILAMGAWFLLDVNGNRPLPPPSSRIETVVSPATSGAETKIAQPSPQVTSRQLHVQLGAFADRQSAQSAFNTLTEAGFNPSLSEPEGQFEIYRISFGPFFDEREADNLSQKLNSLDFHSFVLESF